MGPMEELVHHRMASSYHRAAKRHAGIARTLAGSENAAPHRLWALLRPRLLQLPEPWHSLVPEPWESARAEHSMLALIYAALAIEAWANEIAEELIPFADLDDFDGCKKAFAQPTGSDKVPQPLWRWKIVFDRVEHAIELSDPVMVAAREVIQDRNTLAHYRLSKSATRVMHAPPREENGMVIVWDRQATPTSITESRLVALLRAESATRAEEALDGLLARWRSAGSTWRQRQQAGG
jgi:hypothetical protein